MRHPYHKLIKELESKRKPVLATIIATRGSAPQVPGASALFSGGKILSGTLGGGILEGDATSRAEDVLKKGYSLLYEFDLDDDLSGEGAICGGSATILLDSSPGKNIKAFKDLQESILNGIPGVLVTLIRVKTQVEIERYWVQQGEQTEKRNWEEWEDIYAEMATCLRRDSCWFKQKPDGQSIFLEPVHPLPELIIAGAGHVGKALAHMAGLLDFEVTVIDDRPEYANQKNIPDADHVIVRSVGETIKELSLTENTYIVIVTRGHRDDTEALRACIGLDIPYIGMIGSRKKVAAMREKFLSEGWATSSQFDRIHAPVGLKIGSKTVQEIAVSICAQLVQVRSSALKNGGRISGKAHHIVAVVLAAGESRRMGKPKLLLPFGQESIIEKVIRQAGRSSAGKILVVLGANHKAISNQIKNYKIETVNNQLYKTGMLSSVQCGLRAIPETTEAVMFLLGDQPMIGSDVMDGMIEKFKESDRGLIVATHKGRRGHPILVGAGYFKEIKEFPAGSTLKDILTRHPEDIEEMETENPEILRDIDTEKDYQKELKHQQNYD